MKRLIFSGFGGQGVLTLGQLVATIAMKKGKEVTWMPSYGAEMRGGTANCSVIISEKPIGSPIVLTNIDVLFAMNNPSLDKFLPQVKPGGIVIANTSIINKAIDRDDVKVINMDATNIAIGLGSSRVQNMVMLAGYLSETDMITLDDIKVELNAIFAEKRPELIPLNIKAVEEGMK